MASYSPQSLDHDIDLSILLIQALLVS